MEKEARVDHPCRSCGACCAFFRVSFYWREAESDSQERAVPKDLTDDYSAHLRCMRGTSDKHHVRCVALQGKIGTAVACGIYDARPSPCRDFTASFENGGPGNPRCDQARAHYGLRALTRKDWDSFACGHPAGKLRSHEATPDL